MSRFYEALKGINRLPVDPNEKREEVGTDSVEAAFGIDLPPFPSMPPVVEEEPPETQPRESGAPSSIEEALLYSLPPLQEELSPTVASIALDQSARVIPQAISASVVEHYRRLRTKILQQQSTKTFQTLVVASPSPQEGKTVTVLNLGFSFAMLPSFKVLLVDGDLRKGSLGKWLGLDGRAGFSNLIEGTAKLEDVVLKADDNPLHFMVRGNSQLQPAELLHSPDLRSHFRQMAEHFDLILVDSPPVNLVTDTQQLAGSCDAVLLVVRAFISTRKSFDKAYQEMQPFRVIGTVLNSGTRSQSSPGAYHDYYGEKK